MRVDSKVNKVFAHSIYRDGENTISSHAVSPISNLLKDISKLERETSILFRLRKIQNELISNSGYHTKNMEKQIDQLQKIGTPKNEIDLIIMSYDIRNKYTKKLWVELKDVLLNIEKQIS